MTLRQVYLPGGATGTATDVLLQPVETTLLADDPLVIADP